MFTRILLAVAALALPAQGAEEAKLFDGKTFKGWEGNEKIFRIEKGAIVGGTLKEKIAATNSFAPRRPTRISFSSWK